MYEQKRAHPLCNVPLTISNAPCAVAAQGALPVYGEKNFMERKNAESRTRETVSFHTGRCGAPGVQASTRTVRTMRSAASFH